MLPRFLNIDRTNWPTARRYGVPAGMVERATQRRLAGDWRGACTAANVHVHIDLQHLTDRYGTDITAQVSDDLTHLAPDLLRWHLPRVGPQGLLAPDQLFVLADYDHGLRLVVRTPPLEAPQQIRLDLVAPPGHHDLLLRPFKKVHSWQQARYLWDARAAHLLLDRIGGDDRTPFFLRDGRPCPAPGAGDDRAGLMERVILLQEAGEIEPAWTLAGVRIAPGFAAARVVDGKRPRPLPRSLLAMVPVLARTALGILRAAPVGTRLVLPSGSWDGTEVTLRVENGQLHASRSADVEVGQAPVRSDALWQPTPQLPEALWQPLPDLALLRAARVSPAQLHPLVRAALFPDQPDPGYDPLAGVLDGSTVDGTLGGDIRLRCRGGWHRIGWRDGRLTAVDHTAEDIERERTMRALGGPVAGCTAAVDSWHGLAKARRRPRALLRLCRHAILATLHGDADEVRHLLDAGIDLSRVRDRHDRTLVHHLAKVDGGVSDHPATEVALLLLTHLRAGIRAHDQSFTTPLPRVLEDGGSAALVRAMLDRRAELFATGRYGAGLLHYLSGAEADQIVPMLVAHGADPNRLQIDDLRKREATSSRPLAHQLLLWAPAATIRALLDAGADPALENPDNLRWFIERRHDLGFLADAMEAAGGQERS